MVNLRVLLQIQRGLLFRYGWLRAWWEGKPVDASGDPLPWLTYPAIDFLSQFDFSQASVFEWGSGFSTLWWAKRCQAIITVESSETWAAGFRALVPVLVEFLLTPHTVEAELEALLNHSRQEFDVIVIDNHGPYRWRCAEVAVSRLSEGGMIILDNSDQCLKAAQILRTKGLLEIDFSGFVPGYGYAQTTSIFFRGHLKFPTLASFQPQRSIAQPNVPWPNC